MGDFRVDMTAEKDAGSWLAGFRERETTRRGSKEGGRIVERVIDIVVVFSSRGCGWVLLSGLVFIICAW